MYRNNFGRNDNYNAIEVAPMPNILDNFEVFLGRHMAIYLWMMALESPLQALFCSFLANSNLTFVWKGLLPVV